MFKSVKTIADAKDYLKNKFNIVCEKASNQSDEKYFSHLMEIIMEKEDENIYYILDVLKDKVNV